MKKLLFVLVGGLVGCATSGGSLVSTGQNFNAPEQLLKDVRNFLEEAKTCQTLQKNTQLETTPSPK